VTFSETFVVAEMQDFPIETSKENLGQPTGFCSRPQEGRGQEGVTLSIRGTFDRMIGCDVFIRGGLQAKSKDAKKFEVVKGNTGAGGKEYF